MRRRRRKAPLAARRRRRTKNCCWTLRLHSCALRSCDRRRSLATILRACNFPAMAVLAELDPQLLSQLSAGAREPCSSRRGCAIQARPPIAPRPTAAAGGDSTRRRDECHDRRRGARRGLRAAFDQRREEERALGAGAPRRRLARCGRQPDGTALAERLRTLTGSRTARARCRPALLPCRRVRPPRPRRRQPDDEGSSCGRPPRRAPPSSCRRRRSRRVAAGRRGAAMDAGAPWRRTMRRSCVRSAAPPARPRGRRRRR